MKSRIGVFGILLVLMAFAVVLPKPGDLFWNIVTVYAGFVLLILYPFLERFRFPGLVYVVVKSLFLGCIGYGWIGMAVLSNGAASGAASFFGALMLMTGISGLILSLIELSGFGYSSGAHKGVMNPVGMFLLVRHPHALFGMVLVIGFDLYYWSIAMTLSTPLWIIGFVAYAAIQEKIGFIPRFNEAYLDYCTKTPALFPNRSSIKKCIEYYR
ncbi:hypothetical protein ACFL6I_14200 [candidate division KSB1 bacterium]